MTRWRAGTLVYTRRGLVRLFCWLLWGDFALSFKDRSILPVVQLVLRRFQVSDALAGFLLGSVPALIGLLVVPIVSYRSDRHRGKWGRRIPFLAGFTAIACAAMLGLALESRHAAAASLWRFGACWGLFEFASITMAASLVGALINDVVPPSLLGRFFGLFRIVSLAVGIGFNYWLLAPAEKWPAPVFVGTAVLYGAGFALMCLKVREGDYPPATTEKSSGVRAYFSECFADSRCWWIFATVNLSWLAFVPVNLYCIFFAKSIGMPMSTYGRIWAGTYLGSLLLSYPMGLLADRWHPLRLGAAILVVYAAIAVWGGFAAGTPAWFGAALAAHGVLSGLWQTGAASLPQRLLPADRFAQFASAMGIIGAIANIVLPPILGTFLDHVGHQYRYSFFASALLALGAVAASVVVARQRPFSPSRLL